MEYAKTPIPFEDLPAFEFSEPSLPKEEPKKKEENQPEETKESEIKQK
jgi:hypothetical protein